MPEDVQSLLRSAEASFSQKNWDKAIELYQAVMEADPKNEEACSKLAELFAIRGLISNVVEQYFTLMDVLEQKEEYKLSVEVARWIMKLQPDNDKARMKTILIYKKKGDMDQVVKQSLQLARLYIELNQGDQSILLLKNAQEIAPDNLDIGLELAEIFISHGNIQEGTNQYRKIANAYLSAGDFEKAAEAFRRMKVVQSEDPQLLFTLGNLYMNLGRLDDAESEFRAILRHDLNHTEALMALGNVCQKKGQFRDAILAFNKILSVNPQNEIAKEKLGELYQAQGATGEAVKHYLQAANIYQYGNDVDRAIKLYQRVLTIDPTNPTACRELTNLGAPLVSEETEETKDAYSPKLGPLDVDEDFDGEGPSLEEMAGVKMPAVEEAGYGEKMGALGGEEKPTLKRGPKGVASKFGSSSGVEISARPADTGSDLVFGGGRSEDMFATEEEEEEKEEKGFKSRLRKKNSIHQGKIPGGSKKGVSDVSDSGKVKKSLKSSSDDKDKPALKKGAGSGRKGFLSKKDGEESPKGLISRKKLSKFGEDKGQKKESFKKRGEERRATLKTPTYQPVPDPDVEEVYQEEEDFDTTPISTEEEESVMETEGVSGETFEDLSETSPTPDFDDDSYGIELPEKPEIIASGEGELIEVSSSAEEDEGGLLDKSKKKPLKGLLGKKKKSLASVLKEEKEEELPELALVQEISPPSEVEAPSYDMDFPQGELPEMDMDFEEPYEEREKFAYQEFPSTGLSPGGEYSSMSGFEEDASMQIETMGSQDFDLSMDLEVPDMETGSSPDFPDYNQIPALPEMDMEQGMDMQAEFSDMDMSGMPDMDMSGMPGMDMPGMDMPGMDMPGMPGMDMPGMDMPGMPDMDMPDMDMSGMPDMDMPAELPDMDMPAELPDMDMPAELPDMDMPAELPDMDMPAELPDMDMPAELPDMDMPAELPDMTPGVIPSMDYGQVPSFSDIPEIPDEFSGDMSFDIPDMDVGERVMDFPEPSPPSIPVMMEVPSIPQLSMKDSLPDLDFVPEPKEAPPVNKGVFGTKVLDLNFEIPSIPEFEDGGDLFGGGGDDITDSFLRLAEEIEKIIPDEDRIREAEEKKRMEEEDRKRQQMEAARLSEEIAREEEERKREKERAEERERERILEEERARERALEEERAREEEKAREKEKPKPLSIPVTRFLVEPVMFEPAYEDKTGELPEETLLVPEESDTDIIVLSEEEGDFAPPTRILEEIPLLVEMEIKEEEVPEHLEEELPPAPEPQIQVTELIRSAVEEGDMGKAFPLYLEAMEKEPENIQLKIEYAELSYRYGMVEEAVSTYSRLLRDEPDNHSYRKRIIRGQILNNLMESAIESLNQYGRKLWEEKNLDESQRIYQYVLALEKENAESREALAEIYLGQNMKVLALYHYNILAQYLQEQDAQDRAIKVLKKIFTLTGSIDVQEKLASAYIKYDYVREGVDELKSLAWKYLQAQENMKATAHYEKIINMVPEDIEAHEKLVDLYNILGDRDKSYKEKVLVSDLLLKKGDVEKAEGRFEECLRINKEDQSVREKLIGIYLERGRLARSLEESQILSEYFHKERRYDKAIALYLKLVQSDPQNLKLREKLSEFYVLSDQLEQGLEQLVLVAEELTKRKDWDSAIKVYKKALTINDKNAEIHFRVGQIYLNNKNNITEARYEFDKVFEIDPNHRKSMEYLVDLYIKQEKPAKAMSILSRLMEIDDQYSKLRDKIIEDFSNKVKENPNDFKSHFYLGIIYKELKMWKQAIEQFQQTRKSNDYVLESHNMLGICFSQQPPMMNLAIKTLEKGLQLKGFQEKEYVDLHYNLGKLYEADKAKKAIAEYQAVLAINPNYKDTAELLKKLKAKIKV